MNVKELLSCGSCSSCVSWVIFPEQILLTVQTTAIHHSIFSFSSFSMFLHSRISKSVYVCSFCFLCSFLLTFYLFHPSILFYSSFCSLLCFLLLFIHFIFKSPLFSFQICYPFFSVSVLFYSVSFSLMLYYSSICSPSIRLVLFLFLSFLDPSI